MRCMKGEKAVYLDLRLMEYPIALGPGNITDQSKHFPFIFAASPT